jgi:hypothetical protein
VRSAQIAEEHGVVVAITQAKWRCHLGRVCGKPPKYVFHLYGHNWLVLHIVSRPLDDNGLAVAIHSNISDFDDSAVATDLFIRIYVQITPHFMEAGLCQQAAIS